MPRRYIPTDYEEEMLDTIAEMTGHFAVDAWAGMTDAQRHAVDHPLWVLCDMYNDGVFNDFESELYSPEYQKILKNIPDSYMLIDKNFLLH
jgi:hypothetical protein